MKKQQKWLWLAALAGVGFVFYKKSQKKAVQAAVQNAAAVEVKSEAAQSGYFSVG